MGDNPLKKDIDEIGKRMERNMSEIRYGVGTKCEGCGAINMVESTCYKGEISFWCCECGREVGVSDAIVWVASLTVAQMRKNLRINIMFYLIVMWLFFLTGLAAYLYFT